MTPGEILFGDGPIVLNRGRRTVAVEVENTSDHTIFVSSHYLSIAKTASAGQVVDLSVRVRPLSELDDHSSARRVA
jgi:urease beta subunit